MGPYVGMGDYPADFRYHCRRDRRCAGGYRGFAGLNRSLHVGAKDQYLMRTHTNRSA